MNAQSAVSLIVEYGPVTVPLAVKQRSHNCFSSLQIHSRRPSLSPSLFDSRRGLPAHINASPLTLRFCFCWFSIVGFLQVCLVLYKIF